MIRFNLFLVLVAAHNLVTANSRYQDPPDYFSGSSNIGISIFLAVLGVGIFIAIIFSEISSSSIKSQKKSSKSIDAGLKERALKIVETELQNSNKGINSNLDVTKGQKKLQNTLNLPRLTPEEKLEAERKFNDGWARCPSCKTESLRENMSKNNHQGVCPWCKFSFLLPAASLEDLINEIFSSCPQCGLFKRRGGWPKEGLNQANKCPTCSHEFRAD